MGRAKLKMELIAKPKQRLLTFKKRKEGLMKKLHQLSTLCDVSACMIIVAPSQTHPSIWPEQNPDQVRRLIDVYRSKDMSSVKSYGVADFFAERKRKAEDELQKLRKTNSQAKFPTWTPAFDSMTDAHLRAVAASLLAKSQVVRSRIQAMRAREAQDLEMMKTKMLLLNSTRHFYNLDHNQEFKPPFINAGNGMQLPMNMNMNMNMNMQQQQQQVVPQNNYYAPPPPMPMPMPPQQPQPLMILPANMQLQYYPAMDQNPNPNPNINYYSATSMENMNINYWVEDAGEATRYLLQQ